MNKGALAHSTTITPKTTGTYMTGKGFKHVDFTVVKKGRQYKLANFSISCMASKKSFGAVFMSKEPTISSSGKFSYGGKAQVFMNGQLAGSATLDVSGKFVSDTKAIGSASFSKATPPVSGCPSRSFTAKWAK